MGTVVAYRCTACSFSSGQLRIGWGKSGRASFWGGLVRCDPCGALGVADLASHRERADRDPRCEKCDGLLTRLEGTSERIPCPRCRGALRHETIGTWT